MSLAPERAGGPLRRVVIVGGAGFIGGHFVDRLLGTKATESVRVFDNFTSGREANLAVHGEDPRFSVAKGEVADLAALREALVGYDTVIHLASNPDIAAAMANPAIDFDQGTLLTHNVLEAMRLAGVGRIVYASGSGVYGDLGEVEASEDQGPLVPVSTYGASKLAGEALISAYSYMFEMTGRVFRFGNVVGPRQSHGVGLDFVTKLLADPSKLEILGDGSQSKSYVHVSDVLDAVLLGAQLPGAPVRTANVATGDYLTVSEIADLAVEAVGLAPGSVEYRFSGGNRGWKGDVPVVRLNTDRIRGLGWANQRSSKEAMRAALRSLVTEVRAAHGEST